MFNIGIMWQSMVGKIEGSITLSTKVNQTSFSPTDDGAYSDDDAY
jgi:hypothetical protein